MRIFLRQKFYSFINTFGLATGLVCTLFISLWIYDEYRKNKFHDDVDNIYQIVSNVKLDGRIVTWGTTPGPLADEIRLNIPGIDHAARTANYGQLLIQSEEKDFLENGLFADPEFLEIMSFSLVQGDDKNPLPNQNAIVISTRLAKKLFGDESALGKVIRVNQQFDQKITAVVDDHANESSISFDFLMHVDLYKKFRNPDWGNFEYDLFLKLAPKTDHRAVIDKINAHVAHVAGKDEDDYKSGDISFYMQPFNNRYLYGTFENGMPTGGRIDYIKIFAFVAIFILLIASINFTNMATARAANRSKEVGIRKTAGAVRFGLISQFILESILISAIALIFALIVVQLLLPMFNMLVSKNIVLPFDSVAFVLSLIAVVIATGVLAGSYPAFFLSAFSAARVLKGNTTANLSGSRLRKWLVILQFSLTVILIASALVISSQVEFIYNRNLGYSRESILAFDGRAIDRDFEAFKNEALKNPNIKTVTRASEVLVQVNNQNGSVRWPGKPENTRQLFRTVVADYDFIETMGLQIKEGRSFSKQYHDTASFILTQTAVDVMGLQHPIGTQLSQWGTQGTVVGVIEDFHSRSVLEEIDPIIIMSKHREVSVEIIHVAFNPGASENVLQTLESLYKKANPAYPFDYSFLDDRFDKLYQNEKVTSSLALAFTFMAIIISGLGMLGLAAYTAERKRKEISIRKSLGASVTGIVSSMSIDFVKLSFVATLIGCPIAYFLMQHFLAGYAYSTPLKWTVFLYTAIFTMIITVLTVVFQVTKAALINPVEALRSE
ncbi:ABC transporter permease [Pseudochryseolinea flava]|nr:ABC transporter permease [Pseudochryseolinea flava]